MQRSILCAGFGPASRSTSAFGRFATGDTTGVAFSNPGQAPSRHLSCLQLRPADTGCQRIAWFTERRFHCSDSIRKQFSCVLSVVLREQHAHEPFPFMGGASPSQVSFNVQQQRRIAECLNKNRFLSGSAKVADEHWRPQCRTCTFSSKPTCSDWLQPFSFEGRSFSSSGRSTKSRGNHTPWKCARRISYVARVHLPFASS